MDTMANPAEYMKSALETITQKIADGKWGVSKT
jgi:hypothetical protein